MASNESVRRKAFWSGVLLSVGFRIFAYGLFGLAFYSATLRPDSLTHWGRFVAPVAKFVGNPAAVLVILLLPFVTGFLSGYFWRILELGEYMKGVWWGAIFFFVLAGVVIVNVGMDQYAFLVPLLGFWDVVVCLMGAATGRDFWRSRLARQFLGDFSTRHEIEYFNCFDSSPED